MVVTRAVEKPTPTVVAARSRSPSRNSTRLDYCADREARGAIEETATRLTTVDDPLPTATRLPEPVSLSRNNVAMFGSALASNGQDSARMAIDGDVESAWNSNNYSVQWLLINLNAFYQVDSLELVVTQYPASETSHEIWFGYKSGLLSKYHEFINVHTAEGHTLDLVMEPAQIIDRVLIRTVSSPSWVAWREVRVFGQPPPPSAAEGAQAPNQQFAAAAVSCRRGARKIAESAVRRVARNQTGRRV